MPSRIQLLSCYLMRGTIKLFVFLNNFSFLFRLLIDGAHTCVYFKTIVISSLLSNFRKHDSCKNYHTKTASTFNKGVVLNECTALTTSFVDTIWRKLLSTLTC